MLSAEPISVYSLMNKDEKVLDFECRRNIYDEPEFIEQGWHVDYPPVFPRFVKSSSQQLWFSKTKSDEHSYWCMYKRMEAL